VTLARGCGRNARVRWTWCFRAKRWQARPKYGGRSPGARGRNSGSPGSLFIPSPRPITRAYHNHDPLTGCQSGASLANRQAWFLFLVALSWPLPAGRGNRPTTLNFQFVSTKFPERSALQLRAKAREDGLLQGCEILDFRIEGGLGHAVCLRDRQREDLRAGRCLEPGPFLSCRRRT
jgi:hypothetical protein